jgi:hypothetical protein
MKALAELTSVADPALPLIRDWIKTAKCPVEILPCSEKDGEDALVRTQVTIRSPMGAICHGTGGIVVDDGWLRILGAGHPRLPRSLPSWNDGRVPTDLQGRPTFLLVGDDAIGGFFAVNGGGIDGVDVAKVAYLAPDTLQWEDTRLSYADFLVWSWSGRLDVFYDGRRWNGWREECRTLAGDRAFSFYPFLWAKGPPIGERDRAPVPIAEMYSLVLDFRRQLARPDQ